MHPCEIGKNRIEPLRKNRSGIRPGAHAKQHHRDLARFEFADHGIKIVIGDFGIGAAQHVIGAQFEQHRVGAVGHRPVEPRQPPRGRIPRHARIADLGLKPALGQCFLQNIGEGFAIGEQIACGETVAECHDFKRSLRLHRPDRQTCQCKNPKNPPEKTGHPVRSAHLIPL